MNEWINDKAVCRTAQATPGPSKSLGGADGFMVRHQKLDINGLSVAVGRYFSVSFLWFRKEEVLSGRGLWWGD